MDIFGSLGTICIGNSEKAFNNPLILFGDVGDKKYVKVSRLNVPEQFSDWVVVQSSS